MKKLFLVFTVLSVILLSACTAFSSNSPLQFDTNEDVISIQALTAASLISNEDLSLSTPGITGQLVSNNLSDTVEENPDEIQDPIVNQIEPYIELVEQLLGSTNGLNVLVQESDLENYESMMKFETSALNGETKTYVIYYNMTLEEEDDDESEYILEGVMFLNDQEYILFGEREVEEDEEKIEFIAKLDEFNYVESEYKVEDDEVKFEITVVSNGNIISESSIKIEDEEDELKIELEFTDGNNEGYYEFKYEVEDGQNILKIEYQTVIDGIENSGEMTVLVLVDELTGETYYQVYVEPQDDEAYENRLDRDIDDDDDDDEEDEDDDDDDEE